MKRFRRMLGVLALPVFLVAAEPVTNEDVVKLAKAGLSESFVLSLIEERPNQFLTDTSRLIGLKQQGVSERIVEAMLKKTPPAELMNTDSVMRLSKAGFSETFLLALIQGGRGQFSTHADRIVELKQAGLSERVIAAMVGKSSGSSDIPSGTSISVRLIDDVDSQKAKVGDTFRASLSEPLVVGGRTLAERGADATLKLVEEKESGRLAGKAMLSIQLVSLKIDGRDVGVNTGEFTQESNSRGKETAVRTGVGSAIGAVVGAIAGGGKGAAIGAGVGAGAGAGSQVFTKGERVRIPSETVLTFQTTAPTAAR